MISLDLDLDDGLAPPPPEPRKLGKPLPITGTFDIETHDWIRFVCGVCYDGHRPKTFHHVDDMIDHMRKVGGTWWGHAAGTFDNLLVLERARQRHLSAQIDRSAHRVTRVVMGRLTLRDSYALWPAPLDELAGAIGVACPSLPWRCNCGKDCGGFCQIGAKAAAGEPDLEDYCISDCRVLYDALHLLRDFCAEHKIDLRGTMGQTAWKTAQAELGVPDSEIPWALWRHAKRADKGGRQTIIRPRVHRPTANYDICSAYPAQLAKLELPVGATRELGGKSAAGALQRARPGVYTVTVTVPDSLFLPPLPWAKSGILAFPVGTFTGTWTLPELCAAFERGVSADKVHSALIWEGTSAVFAPLVARWYEIRRSVGKKTPLGRWINGLSKALTGKFAERPNRSRTMLHPDAIKVCLRKGQCRNGCTGRCGAYEPVDLDGFIWAAPYQKMAPSAYPGWSAYLRASTRVQWLEQAERYDTDLVFGNTDSIWTLSRAAPAPLGDDLGSWDLADTWTELDVRSATSYAGRDSHGNFVVRGIPGLTEEDWKRGHGKLDRGVVTFQRAAKSYKGLFQKRSRRWTLPEGTAERIWFGDRKLGSDGAITHPVDARELRELASGVG
jgi:hypothetical protein